MSEILATSAVEVAKCAAIPLVRQFYYIYNCGDNIRKLKQKADAMDNRRQRLQQGVEEAGMHGNEVFRDVTQWLSHAQSKCEEVEQIKNDYREAPKRFFFGLFPNLRTRYRFGRMAYKKTMELVDFVLEAPTGKLDQQVSHAPPPLVIPDPVPKYIPSQSRSSELEEIVGALNEPCFRMIGVYGMPGLGKTTLVHQVAEKVKQRSMFEDVAVVTVKPRPDLNRIRGQIAEKLGLEPEATDEEKRRKRLWTTLSEKRTVLLILDDLWEKFDFHKVGIPFGEYHRGCKLLLVSRRSDVLSATGSQKNIPLGLLSDSEAWKLFEKIVGNFIKENQDLHSKAIEVVKACSGLPLSIVTMAGTLKGKEDLREWKDALRRLMRLGETAADLQTIEGVDTSDEIEKVAYSTIKLSYENLKNRENDELQLFFLLCAMTSNALSIEDLSRCAKGWGFLKGIKTMMDARNRVFTLIRCLKDSCLLIESDSREQYTMHDLVRQVGISIASREQNMFVVREAELENWHSEDILKKYTSMFLWRVDVNDQLSGDLNCPQLTFFHLHPEHQRLGLPDNFFRRMCGLRVLNLVGIEFSQNLLSSIGSLKELRTLCIHQCLLENIDIICELPNLEVLSLSCSTIKQLPRELRKLKQLRLLDLNNCKELKSVPVEAISSLSKLEELYLWRSFDQWETEQNASLLELKNLGQLTVLEIIVPNVKILPPDFFSVDLQQYKISIGSTSLGVFDADQNPSKAIEMMGFDANDYTIKQFGATKLLAEAEVLILEGLKGVSSICCGLVKEGFSRLKELKITDSPNIRFIIEAKKKIPALKTLTLQNLPELEGFCSVDNDDSRVIEFPELHQLHLSNLENLISFSVQVKENQQNSQCLPLFDKVSFPNLEELYLKDICSNRIWGVKCQFENLRELEVWDFNNLRYLLTSSMRRHLVKLSSLRIYECNAIEVILLVEDWEENKNTAAVFPQLKELVLDVLPKLKRFNMRNSEQFPSASGDKAIESKEIGGAELVEESPSSFFNEEVSFPNLEKLWLHNICSNRIWGVKCQFENLRELEVHDCHNLRYLLTSSMSRHLMKLSSLRIAECNAIEVILLVEDWEENKNTAIVFPQLEELILECLPKLKRFNMRNPEQFPSASGDKAIESKEIGGAELVEESPSSFFNEEVSFPLLKTLYLRKLDNMKIIWHHQLDASSFCKLNSLYLRKLDNMKIIWHHQLDASSFCKLKCLVIRCCRNLESVIPLNMGRWLAALEFLRIGDCSSLREVFETKERHAEKWPCGEDMASEELGTTNLSFEKLEKEWISGCPILKTVHIIKCPALKTVFPAFMAKNLIRLGIEDCEELEGIIARDEKGEVEIRSYFPKAKLVRFRRLPKLKYTVTLDGEEIWKEEESEVETEDEVSEVETGSEDSEEE